ncbi:MAG: protoheme IX farnesyltransferase [Verrucomicrobia bacterium]|nr:protoheme IX farnesyltransferase [Verrucomicrobiota bacterium]
METTAPIVLPIFGNPLRVWGKVASDLVKARLTLMVVLTTWMGYSLGSSEASDGRTCLHAILGTSLLAAGASALNQWWERDLDALMRRTASRPIPAGLLSPLTVLAFGVGVSLVGLAWLAFSVNLLTAFLGAVTLAIYIFAYTPLKRTTELNTWVGAVPGSIPPLMGWTAATGDLGVGGWALFAILFFWQLPHFMAVAWLYRDEYAQAGFRMLSGRDPDGRRSASSAIRNSIALLAVSVVPFLQGISGRIYLAIALVFGGLFLVQALRFALLLDSNSARRLFFASIFYLPVLLAALVMDRAKDLPSRSSFLRKTATFSVPRPGAFVSTCRLRLPGDIA